MEAAKLTPKYCDTSDREHPQFLKASCIPGAHLMVRNQRLGLRVEYLRLRFSKEG